MAQLPPLRPPPRPHSPSGSRSQSSLSQTSIRSDSSLSVTSSDSGHVTPVSMTKRPSHLIQQNYARPSTASGTGPTQNHSSAEAAARQQYRTSVDGTIRMASPSLAAQQFAHRARQHSQGFFEPSLPHTSINNNSLSASQIAAQAAMHHTVPPLQAQERKRSHPGLTPITTAPSMARKLSGDVQSPQLISAGAVAHANTMLSGGRLTATTAANVAYPNGRSPLPSPGVVHPHTTFSMAPPPVQETKTKTSKMKLFSKPKNISLSKDRDAKIAPAMPSPGRGSIASSVFRSGLASASSTSLVGPGSSASTFYSSANASTSTLVPVNSEKEKEKRHHFLSRQKQKFKEEPSQLSLSSAHSNSQPTNPEKPQTLYNFTPDSPGVTSFPKSMSGFDLRHGGRALREKRKEEKAAAKLESSQLQSASSVNLLNDQYGTAGYDSSSATASGNNNLGMSFPNDTKPVISAQILGNIGASMGVAGIGPDDAWPLLRARLFNVFSGEELRTPIEDFNTLVGAHIGRCIQLKQPIDIVEDLRELLQTGFSSLAQSLRIVPDERLVMKLADMWTNVYGSILPFLQAVFLPIDLEFKGRGHIMSVRDAQEFWNSMPESWKSDDRPSSVGGTTRLPTLGEELDVRRFTLITFRDAVILPRHENLMAIFSRLSLDRINAEASPAPDANGRQDGRVDPGLIGADRPGTAESLSPRMSSFNSQGSTLLDAASSSSAGRSRATSNTSAGSFGTNLPHVNTPQGAQPGSFTSVPQSAPSPQLTFSDPAKVTETVARMLQCLYVLSSCQTDDVGQGVIERLTGALKYNWLGRGRTGRDRRGWVGMRNPPEQRVGLVGA